jgi:hypothetical protein
VRETAQDHVRARPQITKQTENVSIPSYERDLQQIAFICGCGHSGTTLVATILSRHPEVYLPLYESEAFLLSEETAVERLDRLRERTLESGKRILIEKTPRHVRKMAVIRRMVPGARFILLVRDGRDVTASIANRYGGDFRGGLKRWIDDNTLVLEERAKPDVLLIRYEDVIAAPQRQIRRLCAFLGLNYSKQLLMHDPRPKFWYGKSELRRTNGVGPAHEDLRNWQVNQPIFDGRGRWKRELPATVADEFERGRPLELMRAFGYARPPWRRLWKFVLSGPRALNRRAGAGGG